MSCPKTTRELFTDDEEIIFEATRPVLLNGIPDFVSKPDLIDRSLKVTLPPIPDKKRRSEDALLGDFGNERPRLVGAMLDAVVVGLRRLPLVRPTGLPRMADFARWVLAVEPGMPWNGGQFLEAYSDSRAGSYASVLDDSPIVEPLREVVVTASGEWQGIYKDLLAALRTKAGLEEGARVPAGWPKTARGLASHLRRIAPALRQAAEISVTANGRSRTGRQITVTTVTPSSGPPGRGSSCDGCSERDGSTVTPSHDRHTAKPHVTGAGDDVTDVTVADRSVLSERPAPYREVF